MKELRCLIVDDEPLAIDLVENFLRRLEITAITRCENGIAAFQRLQNESFDLLFLDIEMPLLTGIELVRTLLQKPAIVITTAYRDYAVEGFELEVLDYLVKPFSFTRFMQTMEKFNRMRHPAPAIIQPVDDFVYLKADRQLIKVLFSDIRYIESIRDYIRVNTVNGEWLCHQSLTDITAKLPSEKFARIHRSFTVALDKVERYRDNCVHVNGKLIPVSRDNRQELRRRLSR